MTESDPLLSGVDDVLITAKLQSRPARAPDYKVESRALGLLAQEMEINPTGVLQKCAELVMELCHADSAGISILEPGGSSGMLRWHAAAGAFAPNLHGTMPREASPCGTVMERNDVLLFSEAERYFPALRDVEPRIYENLLAPWHAKGEAVGTLWAIKHSPEGRFDAEDARVLQSLARFAAAAFQMNSALEDAHAYRAELEQGTEALRESEERHGFLLKLSDALRPLADPAEIQGEATRLLREGLNAGWCYYVDWDLDRKTGLVLRDSAREGLPSLAGQHDVTDAPEFLRLLARGTLLKVRDYAGYEQLSAGIRRKFAALGFRSMMIAPLVKEGRLIASLLVGDSVVRDWMDSEALLLSEAAERTWAAVERGRAEAALRESEERLSLAIQIGQFASWDWDLRSGEITWNDCHFIVQGYAVNEVTPSFEAWLARVHPEDRQEAVAAIERARDNKSPYVHDFRTLHPDGNVRWCASRGRFFYDQEGHPNRMIGVLEDVTERIERDAALRESEERFRRFGEATQDILWMRDAETLQWTYLTPAFETIYGLSRQEALSGDNYLSWLNVIVPEDRAHAEESIRRVLAGEQVGFEYRIKRPSDGAIRLLRNTDFPVTDAGGKVVMIGGVGQDVTDLRTSERRSQLLLAELQHRVRNILAMIRSMVRQSVNSYDDLEEFTAHLSGRLDALARTQVLLTRAAEAKVDLESLVRDELEVQLADQTRVKVAGPKVALSAKAAEVLTLGLHELATNSVKYGALMDAFGQLSVTWGVAPRNGEDWLQITWDESCRGSAPPSIRRGFGTELIEDRVPYELNGMATLYLTGGGVKAEIAFPLRAEASILETGPAVEAGDG